MSSVVDQKGNDSGSVQNRHLLKVVPSATYYHNHTGALMTIFSKLFPVMLQFLYACGHQYKLKSEKEPICPLQGLATNTNVSRLYIYGHGHDVGTCPINVPNAKFNIGQIFQFIINKVIAGTKLPN